MSKWWVGLIVALAIGAPVAARAEDLTGSWSGIWRFNGLNRFAALDLSQAGGTIIGTWVFYIDPPFVPVAQTGYYSSPVAGNLASFVLDVSPFGFNPVTCTPTSGNPWIVNNGTTLAASCTDGSPDAFEIRALLSAGTGGAPGTGGVPGTGGAPGSGGVLGSGGGGATGADAGGAGDPNTGGAGGASGGSTPVPSAKPWALLGLAAGLLAITGRKLAHRTTPKAE